ncbi:MAG: SLBB domain-containing protein [Ferruginibacter sp.]|nr:SLBB domain-containing protein [Ferruginibacter sp.]
MGQSLESVKIETISDDVLKNYYLQAISNGISEQDLYNVLRERGLPEAELQKLIERLSLMKADTTTTSRYADSKPLSQAEKKDRFFNQDANLVPSRQIKKDLTIFGAELFTTNSMVFEPNLRIPTPAGYILGPDDEIVINVFGFSEKTYNVTVNEEGNIYIPQVGPIHVNGLSIEQASSRIRTKLASTIYRAINGGQTQVQISLGKIRSIRVTVIGEAIRPGTLTVSSLTTLFNALYLCGGPSDMGSYRKIELIRGNELKRTIDLYSFLLKGDQKDNLLLQEGDVIRIPYYKVRVLLNGQVKRKGKYELIDGETFEDVLQFSGGFADDAYKLGIKVYQLTDKERKIIDINKPDFSKYQPLSSDSIIVTQLKNSFENKLVLEGAVMRSGEYELSPGLTLKQLIEKAGGVMEDVYTKRGSISRLNANKTPSQLSFDIDSVLNGLVNVTLRKNDSVTIYSIFDLSKPTEVSIEGLVKKPGKYKWAENLSLNDVILSAGGLTEAADPTNIEIARRIENANFSEPNHIQTEIILVNLNDPTSRNDLVLKSNDVINIRQRPGYVLQRTVYIEGMVVNPGRYSLQMSGDRIRDLMARAGGFRANADTTAIIIRRLVKKNQSLEDRERTFSKLLKITDDSLTTTESLRKEIFKDYSNISIDLNKALHDPESLENMVLEDGDVITIETNTNLVKVSGEVYFPTIIPFKENENLSYYIEKSGSFTPLARKSGAIVIYPDGRAKQISRFLFFKKYPEVTSRSEIFVPQKSDKNKTRISIGEWSVVLSSLAIIANVIISLRN